MVVYEVNNTLGERKVNAIPVHTKDGTIAQTCEKQFYVSPFNDASGQYLFRLTLPGEELMVGVALRNADGPILTAQFRGQREELADASLLWALARVGWMTINVIAAIHYEAFRLWLKGLRVKSRPSPPQSLVSIFAPLRNSDH